VAAERVDQSRATGTSPGANGAFTVPTWQATNRRPRVSQPERNSYPTMLWRAWRLRCPRCGLRPLFKNLFSMNPVCTACHLKYEREPGYFLGSIYVNYGVTALLVTVAYMALVFSQLVEPQTALWIVTAFVLVFPIWFFRYARSLWLGFDNFWDPQPEEVSTKEGPFDEDAGEDEPWREG
jgi:uncharacterized protein (DUF983 family)